jgi:hypothetical protein
MSMIFLPTTFAMSWHWSWPETEPSISGDISRAIRSFLDFLASEEARESIAELEHVELTKPAEKPEKIKEVYYKRKKVTLKQPILSY